MALRDNRNNIDVAISLDAIVRTAVGTGASVDLRGYDSATLVVFASNVTDGTWTPRLEHGTDGTNFGTCGTDELIGTFSTLLGTGSSQTTQRVGYRGPYRYVRGILDETVAGTCTTALLVVRGHSRIRPLA